MSGCANVQALERPHPVALPMPPEVAERFAYEAGELHAELSPVRENSTYRVFEGKFDPGIAGSDDDTPITFEYYEQLGKDKAPVVLVLPILNGQKHVVRPFATYFADNGYHAVIVDTVQRKTLLEDMLQPEEAIRRTTIRHRRVLDWIDTMPNIDGDRIAVFGASLGGFNALFVSAADERISASALALVAGDLPFVLTNSSERRIIDAADGAMETLQTDREGLRRSRGVFNGRALIQPGADGSSVHQSNANLLLSPLAEMDTKPELEIYADEVEASHGATVGQLDETAVFYLRSRGLSEAAARRLLTTAFCHAVTDRVRGRGLAERIAEMIDAAMPVEENP